jgi:hypothetical protein
MKKREGKRKTPRVSSNKRGSQYFESRKIILRTGEDDQRRVE